MTVRRSTEELAMRALIEPELRRLYPGARIVHEPSLRYSESRLDMAAITARDIVGVEIKSSRDVIDRLERQLRSFAPICAKIILALAPCWNEQLPHRIEPMIRKGAEIGRRHIAQYTPAQQIVEDIGGAIEIWTVDAESGRVERTREVYSANDAPWLAKMLELLHVAELTQVAAAHRIPPAERHDRLVRQCVELMTGSEILKAVCGALRARDAFAAGSDAPIGALRSVERDSRLGGAA